MSGILGNCIDGALMSLAMMIYGGAQGHKITVGVAALMLAVFAVAGLTYMLRRH